MSPSEISQKLICHIIAFFISLRQNIGYMEQDFNYADQLKFITNTRLLFNSIADEAEYNGIGSFEKNRYTKCTQDQLQTYYDRYCKMAEEISNDYLPLPEFIPVLQDCKEFYDLYIRRNTFFIKEKEKSLLMLFNLYCYPDKPREGIKDSVEKIFLDLEKKDKWGIMVVFLLHLGVINLSNKQNDVESIIEDFNLLLDTLESYFIAGLFSENVRISFYRNLIREGETYMNRLWLIRAADDIMASTILWNDTSEMMDRHLSQRNKILLPDVESNDDVRRIWMEKRNGSLVEGTFYEFILLGNNCYQLGEYKFDNKKWQLVYTYYTVQYFEMDDNVQGTVIHPKSIFHQMEHGGLDSEYIAYFYWLFDNYQKPTELELTFNSGSSSVFGPRALSLLKDKKRIDMYTGMLEKYTKVNKFPETEYQFYLNLYAITRDNLFIADPDEECYYQIPADNPRIKDVIDTIHFGNSIGLVEMNGKKYVDFDELGIVYNVTTKEDREKNNIRKVKDIF